MDELINEIIEAKKNNNIDEFSEKLYKYYESYYFDTDVLHDIAVKIDLAFSTLSMYISKYAYNVLNMTDIEFDEHKRKMRDVLKDIKLNKNNPILEKEGIITNLLYRNEKEKEFVLKTMYLEALKNDFNSEFVENNIKEFDLSYYRYFNFLEEAALLYFDLPSIEFKRLITSKSSTNRKYYLINKKIYNKKLKNTYDSILNTKTFDEVIDVIENSDYQFSYILSNFRGFEMFYNMGEIYTISKNIELYKKYQSDKNNINKTEQRIKQKQDELSKYEKIINEFIICDVSSLDEFLDLKEINRKYFDRIIKLLNIYNNDLYQKYIDKIDELNNKENEKKKKIIDYLIEKIDSKLIENDIERDFDLLDIMITLNHIPFKDIIVISKKIKNKKANELTTLLNKSHTAEKDDLHFKIQIMKEKRIVEVKKDPSGKFIEGSGRELTNEEKEKIILFLEKNKLPLNIKTFNVALRRYLNGVLIMPSDVKTLSFKEL